MTDNALEIANDKSLFNDDILTDIKTFDDALAALESVGAVVENISDYGTGFSVIEKGRLVGVPFVILEWRFNKSEMSDLPFVSAMCVTETGEKVVINDGSTGVRDQLMRITLRARAMGRRAASILVPKGLVESNYKYIDGEGKERPATTFYLSESA